MLKSTCPPSSVNSSNLLPKLRSCTRLEQTEGDYCNWPKFESRCDYDVTTARRGALSSPPLYNFFLTPNSGNIVGSSKKQFRASTKPQFMVMLVSRLYLCLKLCNTCFVTAFVVFRYLTQCHYGSSFWNLCLRSGSGLKYCIFLNEPAADSCTKLCANRI